jgi:hypothetical protein
MGFRPLVAVATAAAVIVPATQAVAAGWKRVTAPNGTNIDQVGLVRTADGVLHLAWHIRTGGNSEDLRHTTISPAGVIGATTPIVTNWVGLQNPALVAGPEGLRAFFSGIRTTDPTETLTELATATSTDAGLSWSLAPNNIIPLGGQAYGSPISAVRLAAGTFLQSWAGSLGTWVHAGLDPAAPNRDFQAPLGTYGYDPGLAADVDGLAAMAWYSNATGHQGVFAQQLDANGAGFGPTVQMPGTSNMLVGMLGRTPIVARVGGGFFVAYATGYPALNTIRIWRMGTTTAPVVAKARAGNSTASIAATADGRLWVVWAEAVNGVPRVLARRSNRQATVLGATVTAGRPSGASTVYRLDANPSPSGPLDLFGTFTIGTAPQVATWHTRVMPGLTLTATSRTVRRDRPTTVQFRVTDAGDPVRGARVKVGPLSRVTAANGRVALTISAGTRAVRASATAKGYVPAALGLRRTR